MKVRIAVQRPGLAAVLLACCAAPIASAQQPASGKALAAPTPQAALASAEPVSSAQPAQKPEAAAPRPDAGSGIKIHGHWKFVVHNPDGTLVSVHEFENSLLTPGEGDLFLAALLTGKASMGDWAVGLCDSPISRSANCTMLTTNGNSAGYEYWCQSGLALSHDVVNSIRCYNALSVAVGGVANPQNNPVTVVFSGSYTAPGSTTVAYVFTTPTVCAGTYGGSSLISVSANSSISPNTCQTTNYSTGLTFLGAQVNNISEGVLFTGTATSQALTDGQILTVTVTITFS
jgi:hypothetical protein